MGNCNAAEDCSSLVLGLGIASAICWFLFTLFIILIVEIKLSFSKYKSMLTAAQRFGVVLSLKDVNFIFFNDELTDGEVLEVWGSAGHHDMGMDGRKLDTVNSPWNADKIDPGTGNLKDYSLAEDK
jgi:hypothetical protein